MIVIGLSPSTGRIAVASPVGIIFGPGCCGAMLIGLFLQYRFRDTISCVKTVAVIVPLVLPVACAWVAAQERAILRGGVRLNPQQMDDARRAGVQHPQHVRLRIADEIPLGMPAPLRAVGRRLGLISQGTIGMSLRYGILVRADAWGDRHVLVHELVHTAQYERLGSIWAFLRRYLRECFTAGYSGSEMEQEAQSVADRICG